MNTHLIVISVTPIHIKLTKQQGGNKGGEGRREGGREEGREGGKKGGRGGRHSLSSALICIVWSWLDHII